MLKNMSIAQKLSAGFAIIVLAMVGVIWLLLSQLAQLNSTTDEINDNLVMSLRHLSSMRAQLGEARRNDLAHALIGPSGYDENERDFKKAQEIFLERARAYGALAFSTPEEETVYRASMQSSDRYFTLHDNFASAVRRGDMELALRLSQGETRQAYDDVMVNIQRLSEINGEVSQLRKEESGSIFQSGRQLGIGIGVLVIFFVVLLANFLIRQIRNPVMALLDQTRKVAAGDLTARLDMTHFSNDELGTLAKGFGDMQGNLRTLVSEVSGSVVQLSSAAEEISAVASQSASNMNAQQHELNQLATAMNQMQATVQEVSRNTSDAASSAGTASQRAEHGSSTVQESILQIEQVASAIESTASVINQLGDDSRNIGVVLDVIRGIAEQTNLLALNAAIEAARAGEQGRGFAVVADEVRTLAKCTQDSTTQINTIIAELQQRAEQAGVTMQQSQSMMSATVETARDAGSAIAEISGAVGSISHMNIRIATATEEQGAVSEELNRNVVNISNASEEVATGATQMAQACNDLNHLATQLHEMVGRFKV
ncbi:methyl-accepting chemotaxis protein [Aeromonas allosaccharophila]|uniref:methyl-accepting chemotaxis protein n=1 Tax=Aeromonas allosaccharophila TaxID=656 RepID=UPI003442F953